MARASRPTLLSLDRWARIAGLSPVHFAGAAGSTFWPVRGACTALWTQHAYQANDLVSREELAATIADVEEEIAHYLHWDVAPKWRAEERREWPAYHDPTAYRLHGDSRGGLPKFHAARRRVIAGGVRAVTLVEAGVAVVRSDVDGDGFSELATVTVATSVTDPQRLHLFTAGHAGQPAWEIRPLKSASIVAGTATITLDSWLLIDPDLWEFAPTGGDLTAIDIEDAASYVGTVDVYEVYNDDTVASSTLVWPSGANGSLADPDVRVTQNGFVRVVDSGRGLVTFYPATYADGNWTVSALDTLHRPEEVVISYYAGHRDERYRAGDTLDPLSDYWAQAIAWMVAARLPGPVCGCANFSRWVEKMQTDLTLGNRTTGFRVFGNESTIKINPFGWRYGEVMAWRRVEKEVTHA